MPSDLYDEIYQWFVDLYKAYGFQNMDENMRHIFEDYVRKFDRTSGRLRSFDYLVGHVSGLRKQRADRPRVLFHQALRRYPGIHREASTSYNLSLFGYGFRPAFGMASLPYSYYPAHRWYRQLYQGILAKDNALLEECYLSLESLMKKIAPDCLVLNDDAQPDSRMLVKVAKGLGIPVAEIQHGVYDGKGLLPAGRVSDHLFVWGKYTADIFVDSGLRTRDSISILGYPNTIVKENIPHDKPVVFYLGQDYENYDPALKVYNDNAIRDVKLVSEELGFQFEYRPHPNNAPPGQEPLNAAINRGDVFISFNSTALLEARMRGKLGIQYANYQLDGGDIMQRAGCHCCTDSASLREFLASSPLLVPWDSDDFIEIPEEGPGKRFVSLLNEVMK
ncbi:MAG TPA: hypothetical protein VGJ92_03570 [Methanocella sp.]|jgi:glycosyltransferase involved in cell wall biosynthesis